MRETTMYDFKEITKNANFYEGQHKNDCEVLKIKYIMEISDSIKERNELMVELIEILKGKK